MSDKLTKIFSILQIVLLAVSVLVFLLYWTESTDEGTFLVWAYILLGLAVASAILFSIGNTLLNIKRAYKSLLGIVILAVIVVLSYVLSSDDIPKFVGSENFQITNSLSKNIGAGLITMYILGGLAVIGVIYSAVSKLFK